MCFRVRIVTGNHQRPAILRPRGLPMGGEFGGVDVIEALHHFGRGKWFWRSSEVVVDSLSSSGM